MTSRIIRSSHSKNFETIIHSLGSTDWRGHGGASPNNLLQKDPLSADLTRQVSLLAAAWLG